MGGGKDNHVNKGWNSYSPQRAHPSCPPTAYHYPYQLPGPECPPPLGSYPQSVYPPDGHGYAPFGYLPCQYGGYPSSGYTPQQHGAYPPSGYPSAPSHHGLGSSSMGAMLIGWAAATAAYGVHHMTQGHHHGHHLGHYGKFKHHRHGHHGKFGKHMRFGGKHGLLGWKHRRHGFFGGKFKRWK